MPPKISTTRSILYFSFFLIVLSITVTFLLWSHPKFISFKAKETNKPTENPFVTVEQLADINLAKQYSLHLRSAILKPEDTAMLINRFKLFQELKEIQRNAQYFLKSSDQTQPTQGKQTKNKPSGLTLSQQQILQQLESEILFPWLKSGTNAVTHTTNSKGIVMTTGNKFFSITVHAIQTIRLLGCHLPIEIFYMGDTDLTRDRRTYLENMLPTRGGGAVRVKDLTQYIDIHHEQLLLYGWFVKPFAMLCTSFTHFLFLDADVIFLQDPSLLFTSVAYQQTGTAFFYDRLIARGDWAKVYSDLLHTILQLPPQPPQSGFQPVSSMSERKSRSRMINAVSEYEMDSGVVVMNKHTHRGGHFYGLLLACLLNSRPYRPYIQRVSMGDKETYWMAMEILREPYSFVDHFAGTIGNPIYGNHTSPQDTVLCGSMAHFDDLLVYHNNHSEVHRKAPGIGQGRVFWFQDSILLHKRDPKDHRMVSFTHTSHADNLWSPVEHEQRLCSMGAQKKELNHEEKELLEKIKGLYDVNLDSKMSDYGWSETRKQWQKRIYKWQYKQYQGNEFNHDRRR